MGHLGYLSRVLFVAPGAAVVSLSPTFPLCSLLYLLEDTHPVRTSGEPVLLVCSQADIVVCIEYHPTAISISHRRPTIPGNVNH